MKILYIKKRRLETLLLIAVLVFGTYLLFFSKTPIITTLTGRQQRLVPIYYVDTEEKKVAFSFDACWGSAYTPTLLKILRENNIRTTFFLTGFWVEKYPEMVTRISKEGHEIGNHSYSHPHLNGLGEQEIKAELRKVGEMIFERQMFNHLFRPLSENTATK